MHMREHKWAEGYTDCFEAFKSYDEAGSTRRVDCLKYLVLANMWAGNDTNPFDAQETQPHKTDSEIEAMPMLVQAYDDNNVKEFERVLKVKDKVFWTRWQNFGSRVREKTMVMIRGSGPSTCRWTCCAMYSITPRPGR